MSWTRGTTVLWFCPSFLFFHFSVPSPLSQHIRTLPSLPAGLGPPAQFHHFSLAQPSHSNTYPGRGEVSLPLYCFMLLLLSCQVWFFLTAGGRQESNSPTVMWCPWEDLVATDNLQSNNCWSYSNCHTIGSQFSWASKCIISICSLCVTQCYNLSLILRAQKFPVGRASWNGTQEPALKTKQTCLDLVTPGSGNEHSRREAAVCWAGAPGSSLGIVKFL